VPVNPDTAWHSFSWYTRLESQNPVRHELRHYNRDAVGQMLAAENAKSLRARYSDADEGMVAEWADDGYVWQIPGSEFTPFGDYQLTAVAALKAIECYAYQACEHRGWHASSAAAFCDALRKRLIDYLPGYEDAPWGWSDETSPSGWPTSCSEARRDPLLPRRHGHVQARGRDRRPPDRPGVGRARRRGAVFNARRGAGPVTREEAPRTRTRPR
jgi:hypothetical protein